MFDLHFHPQTTAFSRFIAVPTPLLAALGLYQTSSVASTKRLVRVYNRFSSICAARARLTTEPSHNYKMAGKSAIMIHYPRAASYLYREAKEFKKSSTRSTTLGLRHVYLPVCGRKSQLTSSRHIVVYLLAKNLTKLLYICTGVFLISDILEYVYHSACDKKFGVQLDPYLVQHKYILCIYVSKLITTQSSPPYQAVLVSTSMVIVIVLLIQHVSL